MSFPPAFIHSYDCLSPAGYGIKALWLSLMAGRTHITQGLGSLPLELNHAIGTLSEEKSLRDHDRATLMGVYLARSLPSLPEDSGVIIGSSRGAAGSLESAIQSYHQGERLKSSTSPVTTASGISSAIARDLKLSGPSFFLSAACSTGLYAVIQGVASLNASLGRSFLVGGIEAANTPFTQKMMEATKVLSRSVGPYPCRPGAADRSGMILSEGAALLHISKAPSSFAIVGIGAATESSTLTGVSESGHGLQRAVFNALEGAGLKPEEIDILVGHGSGTLKGDESELNAYRQIFLDQIPPLVFHKWCGGHMLGASAALSVMLAIEHLKRSSTSPHPYLPDTHPMYKSRKLARCRLALITSMGFGGSACAVVVKNLNSDVRFVPDF
jgi:3-oxoacyl-[acyl-carrier-protein] synthase II